jgi:peptidoglycan/LPS O-acetylase OafA/YrhL
MNWKHWVVGLGGLFACMVVVVVMARVFGWSREDLDGYWDLIIVLPMFTAVVIVAALKRRGR